MSKWTKGALTAAIAVGLFGVASQAMADDTIKIAIAGPQTGPVAQYGDMEFAGGISAELEEAYCVPMGHEVNIFTSFPLDNAVYVAELRSGYTVHPTVRKWAIDLGIGIKHLFPSLPIFINYDPETKFSIKRGAQTIQERK